MCVTVLVGERECGSCGDLEQALGGPLLMVEDYPSEDQAYSAFECLCWVDLRATAAARGFELQEGEDSMEWTMAPKPDFEKAPEGIEQADWEAFLNAPIKFWACPDCRSEPGKVGPFVEWRGPVATCQSCGRTNKAGRYPGGPPRELILRRDWEHACSSFRRLQCQAPHGVGIARVTVEQAGEQCSAEIGCTLADSEASVEQHVLSCYPKCRVVSIEFFWEPNLPETFLLKSV